MNDSASSTPQLNGHSGTLLPEHLEHLRSSAVDDAIVAERGYESIVIGDEQARERLRLLNIPAWARNDDARFPGLLIPLYRATGERVSYQYRPDIAPEDPQTGKPRKYACEKGHASVLDVHPRSRAQIGNLDVPLWITEGVKKADSLASQGQCAIALMGVYNWRSPLGTLGDWEDVPVKGRRVIICFDADARTNINVARAMTRLGKWLQSKGAAEIIYLIPPALNGGEPPKGVDDFFAAGGTLETLIPGMSWAPPGDVQEPGADPNGLLVEQLVEDVLDGTYLWCPGLGRGSAVSGWLRYIPGEGRWAAVPDARLAEDIRLWIKGRYEAAETARHDAAKVGSSNLKHLENVAAAWRRSLDGRAIGDLARMARGLLLRDMSDFDAHPDLLNCANVVVNLRTGKSQPHDPGLYFTQVTKAAYVPGSEHDDWNSALLAIPEDVREYVSLRFGQSITGYIPPDDRVLVQLGKGSNGKTTIVYGIQGALGRGYFQAISERAIITDKSQHPTELMDFRGARVAVLEELPEDRQLNMRRIKMITGPEIVARFCGQDSAPYDTSHSFIISTNYDPLVTETDHGSWRRLLALRYPYKYCEPGKMPDPPGENDRIAAPGLREDLREGRDGRGEAVLSWLVANAVDWYAGGDRRSPKSFGVMPERIQKDTEQWRAESNPMFSCVKDYLVSDPSAHVMCSEFAAWFGDQLAGSGYASWSDRVIGIRLLDAGDALGFKIVKRESMKRSVTSSKSLSHPMGRSAAVPEVYKAWLGMRFKTPEELLVSPEDDGPENGKGGPDQEGSGSSGTSGGSYTRDHTGELADNPLLPLPFPGSEASSQLTLGFDLETADAGELFRYPKNTSNDITPGQPGGAGNEPGFVRLAGAIGSSSQPVITSVSELLTAMDRATEVYGHNILGFDGLALAWHHGLDWEKFVTKARDTELIARQADPPRSRESGSSEDKYDLDHVAAKLGLPGKTDDLKRLKQKYGGYDKIPVDDPEYRSYLEGDLRATQAVANLYYNDDYTIREHKVAALAGRMTLNGFRVDQSLLEQRLEEGEARKRAALKELAEQFALPLSRTVLKGPRNNKREEIEEFTSPLGTKEGRQWLERVWSVFGITDPPRTVKTGGLATGADELAVVAARPDCDSRLRRIIELMGIVTTTRTVYQTARDNLCPDGRVHPSISMRQASGRWSTTNPGLTVFGKRGGRHRERDIFLPDEGHVLFSCDLSQVDMRAMAGHSQDPAYMALFAPGRDVHSEIAEQVFGTKDRRQDAKAVGHGWNYGLGAKRLIERDGMDPATVYGFVNGMQERFPRLIAWREEIRHWAQDGNILDNGFGRRMRCDPQRAYTVAPALMGQGGAGDIMKEVLLRLPSEYGPYLRVMVHDEQVFSCPADEVDQVVATVQEAFTWSWRNVPILCDVNGPGDSWGAISGK